MLETGAGRRMPALFTTTSMRPKRSCTAAKHARCDLARSRDVGGDDERLRAARASQLGHLLEQLAPARDQRHPRPGRGEGERDGAADAARRAGDDDDLAAEAFEPRHGDRTVFHRVGRVKPPGPAGRRGAGFAFGRSRATLSSRAGGLHPTDSGPRRHST